jgi:hypothetical protein
MDPQLKAIIAGINGTYVADYGAMTARRYHAPPPEERAQAHERLRKGAGRDGRELVRGAGDFEDVLDRLSKGVSVPTDSSLITTPDRPHPKRRR